MVADFVFTVPFYIFDTAAFNFMLLLLGVLIIVWVYKFVASLIVGG